jgi:hypothetical protein
MMTKCKPHTILHKTKDKAFKSSFMFYFLDAIFVNYSCIFEIKFRWFCEGNFSYFEV